MSKFFLHVGGLLFFNKRHQSVRRSVIFVLTNFLLIAGIIFSLEIILIFLGVGNIFIPMTRLTHSIWDFLTKLVY